MTEEPLETDMPPAARDLLGALSRAGAAAALIRGAQVLAVTPELALLLGDGRVEGRGAEQTGTAAQPPNPAVEAVPLRSEDLRAQLKAAGYDEASGAVTMEVLSSLPGISILTLAGPGPEAGAGGGAEAAAGKGAPREAEDRPDDRYYSIFENSYVSLWEEDIRSLDRAARRAKEEGVTDIRGYLRDHPEIAAAAGREVRVLDVNAATLELYEAATKAELLGSLDRIFVEDTLPLFIEEIAAVFEGRPRVDTETRIRTLGGNDRYVLMSVAIPQSRAAFDHALVSMIDITERRREQQEREGLLRRERERHVMTRTLAQVTLSLASRRQVDDVLDEILRAADTIVPYRSGNISLIRDGLVEPVRWTGYSETGGEELMLSARPPLETLPLAQHVVHTRRPYAVPDTAQEPGWQRFAGTEWIRSFLIVPILYQDEVRGFLRLDSPERNHFSSAAGERLLPFANAAAVALENARLVEGLEAEIAERRRVEQELRRSLEEKEILVQEIHHRVKNNLAMVSSIMNLQKHELPHIAEVERHFEELQSRIRAIAAVHEQLYQHGSISRIRLAAYVPEIVSGVRTSMSSDMQGIRFDHEIDDVVVTVNEAAPIGLIVTEALTNAVKHAFSPGTPGRVSVRVRRLGDAVELAIADDGVGIPVDPRDDGDGMHSEAAPPEERSSLGMVLMRNLSTQLGANLRIDSSSEGTVVTVRLPPDRVIE